MPPTPLTHRPQTLKQAKKAYRKAGATVRLSESEKAVLERRAVLQERADRIKEREARRKANLKRKEERLQKEREARHRMGIPTPPVKEGIQVGPSQLHLSDFIYAGAKRKRDDGEEDEEKSWLQKEGDQMVQEQQMPPMEPPPSRQPLRPLSANANSQPLIPPQGLKAHSPKVRDFALHEKAVLPKRTPVPSTIPPFQLIKGMREDEVPEPLRSVLLKAQRTPQIQKKMGLPASLPQLRRPPGPKPASQQKPAEKTESRYTPMLKAAAPNQTQKHTCIPPPAKPHSIPEDSFDDFFVSNTQIQRELSPPPTPSTKTTPTVLPTSSAHPPTPSPLSNPPSTKDSETASLLAQISTQDLDFSDSLTQPHPSPSLNEEENDFPDPELEEIVLEYELDSPPPIIKTSTNAATPEHSHSHPPQNPPSDDPPPQKSGGEEHYYSSDYGSENIDDASLLQAGLHQVLKDSKEEKEKQCWEKERAAAAVVECDAFELSTQDLAELET